MEGLSLCYIIKNEELYLEASVRSAAPLAQEIIIHDTGSTDQSLNILRKLSKEITPLRFESANWNDDFAAARNQVVKDANYNWILFLDGDEILDPNSIPLIQEAIQKNEFDCFSLIQRNYCHTHEIENVTRIKNLPSFLPWSAPIYYFDNWMERLYRQDSGLIYEGRIHESLLPSCRRLNKKHHKLPAILHHAGRLKPHLENKLQKYLKLSQQKLQEDKNNPAAWIEYAVNLSELGKNSEAFELCQLGLKKFPKEPELWKIAFQCALRADQFSIAEDWTKQYLQLSTEKLFAESQLSTAYLYQGKFDECEKLCEKILREDQNNFIAHLNLGILNFEQKNFVLSKKHLSFALKLKPEDAFLKQALAKIDSM